MLSFIIQLAFMALWYYFGKDAYKNLKGYHHFRQSRLKGSLYETITRNPKDSLVLLIGVLLVIQFVYMIITLIIGA